MQYYLDDGTGRRGPLTLDQVKASNLAPTTQVWREGMEQWVPADQMPELRDQLVTAGAAQVSPYAAPRELNDHSRPSYPGPQQQSHSVIGIASFVIGLLVVVMQFASIAFATFLVMENPALGEGNGDPPVSMAIAGFGICGGIALSVLGALLGVSSLLIHGQNKLFGILGLAINALILLGVLGLMGLGFMVQAA